MKRNFSIRGFRAVLLFIAGFFFFIPVLTYAYFANDLNTKEGIMNRKDTGVTLFDKDKRPFFTFYEGKEKTFAPISEIPKQTEQAVIAIEDKDFYRHGGFSIKAMLRSFGEDLRHANLAYGGSTITQQLVKNALLKPTKSFLRKYQELVLAFEIERRYSKEEILEMYLNSVYFGQGSFGIEEASQRYFGKDTKDLTLHESALLAGLLSEPSALDPLGGHRDEAKKHQEIVLTKMAEQGYITKNQANEASHQQLVYAQSSGDINSLAPHFALLVRQQLIDKYGEEQIARSGFRVYTTLNLDWQEYAEKVVREQVTKLAGNRASNGAVVVMDPKTGEVRVMIGSVDWFNEKFGKVNVATSLRSPGSSFKPIVYSAALEKQLITPATILKDQPTVYHTIVGDYKPKDFDGKFRGPVLVRRALANSLNIPAVEVMNKVGVVNALAMANRLGITSLSDPSHYGLALVLGAGEVKLLEMTGVYATFANSGNKPDIIMISRIEDKYGKPLYTASPHTEPVLSPQVAFLISSILSDNSARAEEFGNALTISRPAAVKTGTAEDFKDAWTMGYTPSLVTGVWVGNNDGSPMDGIAGSLGAAPIWRLLMEHFLKDTPVENFQNPGGLVELTICRNNGLVLKDSIATTSAQHEYFLEGTEPKGICRLEATPSAQPADQSQTPPPSPTAVINESSNPPETKNPGKKKN